jgi:spore photoproduct lyase
MEDESLWKEVFGYEYSSNNQMEEFMKNAYREKIVNLSRKTNIGE